MITADTESITSDTETYSGDPSSVGERAGRLALKAAATFDVTASYLRENSVRDMFADLRAFIRTHPTQAIAIAVVAGFFVGRGLRRS